MDTKQQKHILSRILRQPRSRGFRVILLHCGDWSPHTSKEILRGNVNFIDARPYCWESEAVVVVGHGILSVILIAAFDKLSLMDVAYYDIAGHYAPGFIYYRPNCISVEDYWK